MSNYLKSAVMMGTLLLATACQQSADDDNIIDRPDFKAENRAFDINALEALGRVSNPQVSPDGTKILFGISYESVEQNKSNNELYVMNIDGSDMQRLTRTAGSENGAVWIDGGRKIAFMAANDGKTQLWTMNADGSDRQCVSNVADGIQAFLFSPDEQHVAVVMTVKNEMVQSGPDLYPDLPKANAHIVDDLMYKHWDTWVEEIPHTFVADFDGKQLTNIVDILEGEPFEAPMLPFGGSESLAWSPDSKQLIYVSRKKTGVEYSISTNSDLYRYDLEAKTTENLTEGNMGYDTNPAYSPDGRYIAWLSMERDGYEADKNRIFVMDTTTGEKRDLTVDWDYTADAIVWAKDGKSIYFLAAYQGCAPIFNINLETCEVKTVADGICDYAAICPVDDETIVTMRHAITYPNEIYSVKNGEATQLTFVNKDIFDQIDMPTVEKRLVPTTDGKEMTTWVVLPPNFDPNKKYPAILYCQGGPQSAVSQFWSYRWNLSLMASNGYVVIAPNRRGLPGFGTEWNEQISKDYPGQNMRDYLSTVDYMKQEPWIDADHIGAVGASYGGFSVYMLAGIHEGRFAALIAHAGIFDMEAQYLQTEEMWFANWDMGGAFWEKDNAAAQRTFANSPSRFVDKWTTPILITHGEYDYRILASQGMMAFNAAKLRGIPAEMVIFPDENHWILKPQNAILWQRVFFRWLDKWLKVENQ